MDLVMPGIDGLEVTRRLRQLPELAEVVIVALSASAYDTHRTQCLEAGCNEFLAKPVQEELLLDSLQRWLNLRWRYQTVDDNGADDTTTTVSRKDIAMDHLPKANAVALWEAAQAGHARGILKQVMELEAMGEPYLGFAQQLRELNKQFEFKQIITLLEPLVSE